MAAFLTCSCKVDIVCSAWQFGRKSSEDFLPRIWRRSRQRLRIAGFPWRTWPLAHARAKTRDFNTSRSLLHWLEMRKSVC
jgi:hypothetical protein